MTWDGIVVFSIAYAIVVFVPGPGLAYFVGQVLGHGVKVAPAQALGIYVGDMVWYTLAATGLAALASVYGGLFTAMKWLGAAYLLYLAFKMWRERPRELAAVADRRVFSHWALFAGSLMVTLSNPKAIVFYLAVLPAIIDLRQLTLAGYLIGALLIAVILFADLAGYAFAAHAARSFFREPAALQRLNRFAAICITGAAILIALR
jgi:threonine/homoserine/homoserine lactone efflux protein